MKRYYIMIQADRLFDYDSHLYKFRVGTSKRDVAAFMTVYKYASRNNYYLAQWSIDTRDFVYKLAKSIDRTYLQLNWVYLDVTALAKDIRLYGTPRKKRYISTNEAIVRHMAADLHQV